MTNENSLSPDLNKIFDALDDSKRMEQAEPPKRELLNDGTNKVVLMIEFESIKELLEFNRFMRDTPLWEKIKKRRVS
jgi:hypothetical protein